MHLRFHIFQFLEKEQRSHAALFFLLFYFCLICCLKVNLLYLDALCLTPLASNRLTGSFRISADSCEVFLLTL